LSDTGLPDPKLFVTDSERLAEELREASLHGDLVSQIRRGKVPSPDPLGVKPRATVGRTHLWIGDAHAKPSVTNERFEWLGRMIEDLRPDVVVAGGDWFDMPSLCYYDRGKVQFEGRRYWKDIEAGVDALLRLRAQLSRKTLRATEWHFLLGNKSSDLPFL
jgi:hypothetical protein